MKHEIHRRIADAHDQLAALHRELAAEERGEILAPAKRKSPVRAAPKFSVVPTELQREKADRLLKAKGLAR